MSIMHSIFYKIIEKGKAPFDPLNPPDFKKKREVEEEQAHLMPVPKGVEYEIKKMNGVPVEYVSYPSNPQDQIIFYIHGGGFASGSSTQRRNFTGYVAKKLRYNVLSVDYCLAPENPFPKGLEECLVVYKETLKKYDSHKIVFFGESAGGNLVLALALMAKDQGLPLPAGIVAASPTVQYSKELPSYKSNADTDCMISNIVDRIKAVYFQTEDKEVLENPYGSPLFGDFHGFPPIFINVSESEVLRDDSYLLKKKLDEQGVKTRILSRNKMMHAYLIQAMVPEAKCDLKEVKKFIKEVVGK